MTYDPKETENLPICTTCGTQFFEDSMTECKICDDPRQYVPPSGQSFTTLAEIRSKHKNTFTPYNNEIISITTNPKFAIGQRAILIRTSGGKNVLWDCITLLDEDTIKKVNELGGIDAIVISHPHYYSTHLEWARAFDCPVYIAADDREWLARTDEKRQVLVNEIETDLVIGGLETGVKVLKLGGHFPGSLVLLYKTHLFIADTLMTTPSGIANWSVNAAGQPRSRPEEANSFSFMWSIPNYIPLSADEIVRMWGILEKHEFTSTHGAFVGHEIEDKNVKGRVLKSAQIQIRAMGWAEKFADFMRMEV
ncbi:putative metallo-beta-lactamase family protein [Naviculisporaceae sp. PSN 640]